MSEKVKVTVEVDPNQEVTIKPFGENLAEKTSALSADKADASVTGTVTGGGDTVDADVDIDF